ncbi:uncharacterized protein A1O5_13402 [Cladophialophora psammophila CBS 110553]|uniref:NB-ARC domain-containing protein n=1 Tax=Cladophialophora psammophila CBS 110553 TaxID=1182543 RepID=W9VCQ2_9EURO|nr:uncharacterized protein A1O5_13402 [Cladophialophora psammophila CBS 110553]EXJ53362.1 hypothetical protein A1O5_13402 [Cladophialophora psammophila CBS 110553]
MHPGALGYPRNRWLDTDHRGMNKFCAADDPNLQVILEELRGIFASLRRSKSISVPSRPVKATIVRSSLGIPVTQHFVGREYTLERVHQLLWTPSRPDSLNIVSIYAAGGMGKTQTAMAYLQSYGEHFGAILEVDGTSYVTCCASFRRIRELLAKDDPVVAQEYLEWKWAKSNTTFQNEVESECVMDYRLVKGWLWLRQDLPWLLLFDNVDDLESFDVRDFFPYDVQGKVLVTSRRLESCEWSQWRCIKLSELHREDSRALFLKQLSLELQSESSAMKLLDSVLDKLGDMPLAIAQASAYISRRLLIFRGTQHKILQRLEEELTAYETAFLGQLQKQSAVALRGYRNDSIFTTWEISFQAIESQDRAAAELLQLMGFLNRRDLDPKLLRYAVLPSHPMTGSFSFLYELQRWMEPPKSQWSDMRLDSCFGLYSSYSLLEYLEDLDSFSMHPLIHAWVRSRLGRPMQIYYATQAMRLVEAGWVLGIYPRSHTEDIFESVKEYFSTATIEENELHLNPDALRARTWPEWLETFIQKMMLLWGILDDAVLSLTRLLMPPHSRLVAVPWRYSYTLGDRVDHLGLVQWSYQEACSRLHYRHPFSLKIAGSYANILLGEDEFLPRLAETWYTWLAEVRARMYGPEHPSTAGALLGIAKLLMFDERYEEADVLFSKALTFRTKALGFEDKLTRNVFRLKRRLLLYWADRTAALSFVQDLYESGHLCCILEGFPLSEVFGVVLYQAFGPNSTLFELYERNPRDCAVLAPALMHFQWTDLVPDASAVTCDFSLPGWCQCLHIWDDLLNSRWTENPTPCDSPGYENATWGPYGGCQGDEYQARGLSEKCDIWIQQELESDESMDAAQLLLNVLQGLAVDSYRIGPRTRSSGFESWAWVRDTGLDTVIRQLHAGECELAGELATALYELIYPRDACFAFLVAQSSACQGALEESCKWYQEAEVASETAQVTCNVRFNGIRLNKCMISVAHWAQGICHWLNGNFTHGQEHILHALKAGELFDFETEWILYDLQMARQHFGISGDELRVITFEMAFEDANSPFIHYQTGDLESGNWAWTTVYDELLSIYGSDTARDWNDCFGTGNFSDDCKHFKNVKIYGISDARQEYALEIFTNLTGIWWRSFFAAVRFPQLYREPRPGSVYSRLRPL